MLSTSLLIITVYFPSNDVTTLWVQCSFWSSESHIKERKALPLFMTHGSKLYRSTGHEEEEKTESLPWTIHVIHGQQKIISPPSMFNILVNQARDYIQLMWCCVTIHPFTFHHLSAAEGSHPDYKILGREFILKSYHVGLIKLQFS